MMTIKAWCCAASALNFSQYAIVTPIADTKSLTIATALRDDVLKHGWARPSKFVIDGASYFKAEVGAGITAWTAPCPKPWNSREGRPDLHTHTQDVPIGPNQMAQQLRDSQ